MSVYKKKLCMTELHITMPHFDSVQYIDGSGGQPCDTFIYVKNGNVTLTTPTKNVHTAAGELMFIPEGLRYYAVWRGENGCDYYSLRIISKKVDMIDVKASASLQRIDLEGVPDTGARFDEIYSLFATETRVNLLRALGIYYMWYADILPYLDPERSPKYSAAVLSAAHYIDEHFAEDFSVYDLAAACHISVSRLHHLFSEQLGTTPTKYRNNVRVEYAGRLLRMTECSVEDIAEKCGFNSAAYFRETFKSETGLTPTEYRAAAQHSGM